MRCMNTDRLRQRLKALSATDANANRQADYSLEEGERRFVAMLFLDIKGFTLIAQKLDPEILKDVIGTTLGVFSTVVESEGGVLEGYAGDSLMAVFGREGSSEIDTERACRAALGILVKQKEINTLLEEERMDIALHVRIGLHAGTVVTGRVGLERERDFSVTGTNVALAARMEQNAPTDGILVTEEVRFQVKNNFLFKFHDKIQPKNVLKPVSTYCLVSENPSGKERWEMDYGMPMVPLLGRKKEIELLHEKLSNCMDAQNHGGQEIVRVIGEAGVGKSRLVHHFVEQSQQGFFVRGSNLHAHCKEYGAEPYSLVLDLLRSSIGLPPGASGEQAAFSLQSELIDLSHHSLLEDEKKERLKQSDDILLDHLNKSGKRTNTILHSIEDGLLDLKEMSRAFAAYMGIRAEVVGKQTGHPLILHIDQFDFVDHGSEEVLQNMFQTWPSGLPLLAIIISREALPALDLTELNASHNLTTLQVEPMDRKIFRQHLKYLAQRKHVPDSIRNRIYRFTLGNPLYTEEMLRYFLQNKIIKQDEDGLTFDASWEDRALPPSLTMVIQSRLDSLPEMEKKLVQSLSVFGNLTPQNIIVSLGIKLLESHERSVLEALEDLEKRGILERTQNGNDPFFKCRQPIVQQVAYNMLLLHNRRRLHRFAYEMLSEAQSPASEIAFHAVRSGINGDGIKWALLAMIEAMKSWSVDEAEEWFSWVERIRSVLSDTEKKETKHDLLESLRLGCLIYEHKSQWDRAQICVEDGLDLSSEVSEFLDRYYKAQFLLHRAYRLTVEGKAVPALSDLARIPELFTPEMLEKREARQIVAMAHYRHGWLHLRRKQFNAAREALLQAEKTIQHDGAVRELGAIYSAFGLLESQTGNSESALTFHYKALEMKEQGTDEKELVSGLVNLADTLIYLKRSEEAREHLVRAIDLCERLSDPFRQAVCRVNLAAVDNQGKRFENALEHVDVAIRVFKECGYRDGLPESYYERAKAFHGLEKSDEAKRAKQEAMRCARQLGMSQFANGVKNDPLGEVPSE